VALATRHHQLDATVLGGFAVALDGRPISAEAWGRTSAERLFKLLLVTPGHRVSREAAGEHLWPDAQPEHQAANLRKALHFARRAVGAGDNEKPVITADRTHISIDDAVDVRLDMDALAAATVDAENAEVAIAVGREDLLPDDPYEDWLVAPRERLASAWTALALARARDSLDRQDASAASPLIDALLTRDPANEEAHRLAIRMLGAQGRHHAARRQFLQCRRELNAAFGVEPSAQTVAELAGAEAAAAAPRESVGRREPRLVGRDAELARVDEFIDRLEPGRGGALVLHGTAGIGKSRLLDEISRLVAASGWRILDARVAELDRGLAFTPLRAAFRHVRRDEVASWAEPATSAISLLVPSLGIEPTIPFSQPGALADAVSTAVALLSSSQPVALAIDDAQWLDPGSASLIAALCQVAIDRPLVVVLALRTDEALSQPVLSLLERVRKLPGDELELGPLTKVDIAPLVTPYVGGARLDETVVDLLFEQSQGNALFCLELARMARDEGRIALRGGTWRVALDAGGGVPPTALRIVRGRCSRLAAPTLDVLGFAAEFDEPVRFDQLVGASSMSPEEVIDALEEAMAAGLVAEAPGGYAFAHPLFRSAVRQDMPAPTRAAVVLAVARTLAAGVDPFDSAAVTAAAAGGMDPAAVAGRALAAAEAGLLAARPLAVAFALEAGRREAALLQRASALATLDRGLAVWTTMPDIERNRFAVSPALDTRGRLLLVLGRESEAIDSFRQAIATGRDAEQVGAGYASLAIVGYRHADYGSAMSLLREGLARAADDELLRAILMTEMGWLEFRLQRLDDSMRHLREAEAVFRRAGSEVWLMRALDGVWGPLETMHRGDEAGAALDEALAIAERCRDAFLENKIRTHLGFRAVRAGAPAQARPHVERAVHLARMMGDAYSEAISWWATAEMDLALGDLPAAEADLVAELELLASLGGNPRQEAIAQTFRTHIARLTGDAALAARLEALAREAARQASPSDEEFERRIHAYLAAPRWVPMSM
jgi:DNA-binding SARP family transcriptional activator/tetratricopeptide (TPR) repeat protein